MEKLLEQTEKIEVIKDEEAMLNYSDRRNLRNLYIYNRGGLCIYAKQANKARPLEATGSFSIARPSSSL